MKPWDFLVCSLAVYRLTVLVSRDAGPWHIFAKLRKSYRLGTFASCPFCTSVWLSAIVNTAYYFGCSTSPLVVFACLVLSMSSISIILDRMFTVDHLVN